MYVVRGRPHSLEADREVSKRLIDLTSTTDRPVVRVWCPYRQVSFGPRDVRHERFNEMVAVARQHGFESTERSVGGHAVAYSGSTVAFARVVPIDNPRRGLTDRYERVIGLIEDALEALGVYVERSEPPGSFCPGNHSLSSGGKLVGIAQRVTASAAAVSGIVIVTDADEIATVLTPVYDLLEVPFDPKSVGSIESVGGPGEPTVVIEELEAALVGDALATTVDIDALGEVTAG